MGLAGWAWLDRLAGRAWLDGRKKMHITPSLVALWQYGEKGLRMKILVVADEECRSLWNYYSPEKLKGVDLIIGCGDLKADYLEFLMTMANVPVYYVRGNHDSSYVKKPPLGCICIDDKVVTYKGVRIMGLGGSMRYKDGPFMYSEGEMKGRINRAGVSILAHRGVDILVTHAPAKGYGDLEDVAHRGFNCFNKLLEETRPLYMLHGHVHSTYQGGNFARVIEHPSGAKIINAFEKYILDYDEKRHSPATMRELAINLNSVVIRKSYRNVDLKDV